MKLYKAITNNDEGVFKSPIVKDKNLYGYKKVNEYFVDNSGWGSENEPALTARQFLGKVKQGYYYGITDMGQFQVYIGEFIKDTRSRKNKLAENGLVSRKKIANNTYELITTTGQRKIRIHNTDILTFDSDKVILNSGGYQTKTTKDRLNKYLPDNIRIYQKDYQWYILKDNEKIDFADNIEIKI